MIVVDWHRAADRLAAVDFDWLLVAGAFLLGTFPSALLIGSRVGHDPTVEGSGNPGATNMFRIAGVRAGVATLIIDVAKALIAALIGRAVGGVTLAAWCGAAALIGHVFPLRRQSRGGKGVACFGGLTIGVWPVLAPFGLLLWIAAARLSRRSFMGALIAAPAVAIGTIIISRPAVEIAIATAMAALVVARHRGNISDALAERGATRATA